MGDIICYLHLSKALSQPSACNALYVFVMAALRPPARAGRRPLCYCSCRWFLSYFFRCLISEVALLIVTKLCHMFNGNPDL